MNKDTKPVLVIGMSWYLEEDFEEIKRVMTDSHTLHRTYAEWFKAATTGEEHQRRAGQHVIRAIIRPQAFKQWCEQRGLNIDSKARMAFANEKAMEAATKGELS